MVDRADFTWFKDTFAPQINAAIVSTPFSLDLLAAIAAQETGDIWGTLRGTLTAQEILDLCVGDVIDADRGRRAFPQTKSDLVAAPRGQEMFELAHEALVRMAEHVPGYASSAKKPNKLCHAFGIFQYDLQFFKVDPDYFLEQRWRNFDASLAKCIGELRAAMRRMGIEGQQSLTDLERVHVAIAYNAGSFKPAKGLKQGYNDGQKFYGEYILDYLRLSQSASSATAPAVIATPAPGAAALPLPTPVTESGEIFEVNVESAPLRLRSEPKINAAKPSANVIAHLPDGHRVRLISGEAGDKFFEIETSLNGALLHGFAASQFLVRAASDEQEIAVAMPANVAPTAGLVAVSAPRKSGVITKRVATATALSLNEVAQPGRTGTTPEALRTELNTIIDYLAVDKATHARYQPRSGLTFCNIYAHDYCHLAGVYLPRVWWTAGAIESIIQGQSVEPRLGVSIEEQTANDLFRWLRAFGLRFGWRQTGTLTKLQTEVNLGAVGLVIACRKVDGLSGHVAMVVPETDGNSARRNSAGEVIAPLQSQAGASNFRRGTGSANWWKGERFADSAFWLHA